MSIKKKCYIACLCLVFLFVIGMSSHTSVSPARAGNLIINSDFSNGASWPWTTSETWPGHAEGNIVNGEFCVTVTNPGTNVWDVQMRQRRLHIQDGHEYTASFTAYADTPMKIKAMVTQGHAPFWPPHSGEEVYDLTTSPQTFSFSFTGEMIDYPELNSDGPIEDTAAEFAFHLGGSYFPEGVEDVTICFDNITLEDPQYIPDEDETLELAEIRVNQVGYFVRGPKQASLIITTLPDQARPWQLRNSNNTVVAEGTTIPFGGDNASGDNIHIIDFSDYQEEGTSFTLVAGNNSNYVSHSFDIRDNLYSQMKYDALAYFYHNRSGIAITTPYVDEIYTRGAGHDQSASSNPDLPYDGNVPCFTGTAADGTTWENCNGDGLDFNYETDTFYQSTSKGWYDAGDHGKYVVNGGISVWTMLNMYERNKYLGDSHYAFNDGTLSIPENNNDVPDILDEARWEVDFIRSMAIDITMLPEDPNRDPTGLVHHMIHDTAWSDVPNRPDELFANVTGYDRAVYPPSLAATFNYVAVTAQCARVWKGIDEDLSARCFDSAIWAFMKAMGVYQNGNGDYESLLAKKNPDENGGGERFVGGGPYDDDELSDEYYWAAAELYVTTKGTEDEWYVYKDIIEASPHYLSVPTTLSTEGSGPMTWKDTAALGTITLAIAAEDAEDAEMVEQARANIIAAADTFLNNIPTQGYGTPYVQGNAGYAWGSNSFVLNEMIIMGLAHDFTHEPQYLNGMVSSMDYLLGRNAMDKSYVSGYGSNPLENPHHRHWAYQAWPREDLRYPPPPAGAISGGPYSGDELERNKTTRAMALQSECQDTPQKCYVDDIDAFTVNEITINWNAPFAWVTAYLDENIPWTAEYRVNYDIQDGGGENNQAATGSTINVIDATDATFHVNLTLTNNSDDAMNGWTLAWVFPGDQQITSMQGAMFTQSGNIVMITNPQSRVEPNGGQVTISFDGTYSGENNIPETFTLNETVIAPDMPIEYHEPIQLETNIFLPYLLRE